MKADRLLSIVLLLQAHGQMTGRELAERLEVSERTVHRDMDALSAAGVPIFALRGRRGGWRLDEDWRTQVPGLDESELRALLLAQPKALGDGGLARSAARALEKLMAALPEALRGKADVLRQRLHVDATGWTGVPENLSALPVLQDALSRDRKLTMVYRPRGKDAGERVVDPLGLVAKGGVWYLVAGTPRGFRTYRVSRIEEARILEQPSRRPAGFDLAAHWRSSVEDLRSRWSRHEAILRVEPRAARSLQAWDNALPVDDPGDRPPDPARASWVILSVRFDHPDHALFVTVGLGPRVEVLAPASLRERVREEHAAALERAPA